MHLCAPSSVKSCQTSVIKCIWSKSPWLIRILGEATLHLPNGCPMAAQRFNKLTPQPLLFSCLQERIHATHVVHFRHVFDGNVLATVLSKMFELLFDVQNATKEAWLKGYCDDHSTTIHISYTSQKRQEFAHFPSFQCKVQNFWFKRTNIWAQKCACIETAICSPSFRVRVVSCVWCILTKSWGQWGGPWGQWDEHPVALSNLWPQIGALEPAFWRKIWSDKIHNAEIVEKQEHGFANCVGHLCLVYCFTIILTFCIGDFLPFGSAFFFHRECWQGHQTIVHFKTHKRFELQTRRIPHCFGGLGRGTQHGPIFCDPTPSQHLHELWHNGSSKCYWNIPSRETLQAGAVQLQGCIPEGVENSIALSSATTWVSRWRWPGILIIFEDDMSVHLYDLLNNQHFDVRFLWVFPVFLKDFNRYHDHFMAEEKEEFCMFFCSFNTFFSPNLATKRKNT